MGINRHKFFDALREFYGLKDVNETRVYPDRIEVFRWDRHEDGRIRVEKGEPQRKQETIYLTS